MAGALTYFSTAPPISETPARVLVVQPDSQVRRVLDGILKGDGYEVISVEDTDEIFRLAAEFEPDLVLLHSELPGASGYEVCGELRAGDLQRSMPIVLSGTELDDEETVARGLMAGADDYVLLARPVELRARLRVQLRNKRYRDALIRVRTERDSLRRDICLDPLTGILNRRSLEDSLDRLCADGERFAVLFADVDHFKRVNDELGHDEGDRVLRAVAETLRQGIRPGDVLGRYGGEEFVIVVAGAGPESARLVAERHRKAVASVDFGLRDGRAVTLSIGVAVHEPDRLPESPAALCKRADAALYDAKHAGRNQVILSAPASARTPRIDAHGRPEALLRVDIAGDRALP